MLKDIVIQHSFGDQELARIRSLRFEILRKPLGLPVSGAVFPGDEDQTTLHILASSKSDLIGCATLMIGDSSSIQLRGMAVANDWQSKGVGQLIVSNAKSIAIERSKTLWCNARFPAIGFYERQGWKPYGDFFEIPVIGPHIVMKWPGIEKTTLDGLI
ncbi:MAG: GNAT family N-acetyltransferase [Planctomycetota bacterium]|nr:GNAT family N-acetyltransferase [Planctomycetota bacterium]